jgi:hypothetical protein
MKSARPKTQPTVAKLNNKQPRQFKCCLCGGEIELSGWRHGHNAQPVKDGRCCSFCNDVKVIPRRIALLLGQRGRE